MSFSEEQIAQMQRFENRVYRQLLGAPSYTPVAILRGEVGSSEVRTRFVQGRILFTKSMLDGDCWLLKTILGNIRSGLGMVRWNYLLDVYLSNIGIVYEDISRLDINEIKKKVRDYDDRVWLRDLDKLTDRELYKENKKSIGGSVGYDNSKESGATISKPQIR